jgi:hypothetical protein
MAEKIPTLSVTKDQTSNSNPLSKPQKPTLSISTSVTEPNTAGEESSQSGVSEPSGTTSTTAKLSLSLPNTHPRKAKADKHGRWSFFGGGSKKEHMGEETLKAMLRQTVGDAF